MARRAADSRAGRLNGYGAMTSGGTDPCRRVAHMPPAWYRSNPAGSFYSSPTSDRLDPVVLSTGSRGPPVVMQR
jgi:hypothetical protein